MLSKTTQTPYYAVIFTSVRTEGDLGYKEMSREMEQLALLQPGFLGMDSAREDVGITVSYWKDLESIKKWKENLRHCEARKKGRELWYASFYVRIARVQRDYRYEQNDKLLTVSPDTDH